MCLPCSCRSSRLRPRQRRIAGCSARLACDWRGHCPAYRTLGPAHPTRWGGNDKDADENSTHRQTPVSVIALSTGRPISALEACHGGSAQSSRYGSCVAIKAAATIRSARTTCAVEVQLRVASGHWASPGALLWGSTPATRTRMPAGAEHHGAALGRAGGTRPLMAAVLERSVTRVRSGPSRQQTAQACEGWS
jgi:hypothetical protein